MDWFERITGFREDGYERTRARLAIEGETLVSTANGARHGIGRLELTTLQALRDRAQQAADAGERTRVSCLAGDVRALHSAPEYSGAWFQVASQFNLLEMTSPDVRPEHGVTRYAFDRTQGPACAIAAGAAAIYRNYFAPAGGGSGQTADRQIDALAALGGALSELLGQPVSSLWVMKNGYALCSVEGLQAIGAGLRSASAAIVDRLRGQLAIGLHRHVQVTDGDGPDRPFVSQALCSGLPIAYTDIPARLWEPFARLVLEAAYEATLLAAREEAAQGGSNVVLLTRVGGGAFGNEPAWITDAIDRALRRVEWCGLDVRLVSRGSVTPESRAIEQRWRGAAHGH